jgi:transposase
MWFPESRVKVWLWDQPTDMRKSYDGLSALVKTKLEEDPLSGHLFVFLNRRRTQMKVLYFDRSGYCIWSKRLEQGRFHWDAGGVTKQALEWTELKMILEGIDPASVRSYKRYRGPTNEVRSGRLPTHERCGHPSEQPGGSPAGMGS